MTDEMVTMKPPVENGAAEPKTVRVVVDVKVDAERIQEFITLDEYIAAEEGNTKSAKIIVAANLWDATNKRYFDYEEALTIVGKMKMKQAKELFQRLMADMGEEAVPKEYEIASGSG